LAVGVYLVSYPLSRLRAVPDDRGMPHVAGSGSSLVDQALRDAGLGGPGVVDGPGFIEKLAYQKLSFDRLCADVLPQVALPSLPLVAMPPGWASSLQRVRKYPSTVQRGTASALRDAGMDEMAAALVGSGLDIKAFEEREGIAPETGERPLFPGDYADLWLPVPFAGVLVVPGVEGRHQRVLTIGSAVEITAKCQALADALCLDLGALPPIESQDGYVLVGWRAQLEPSADPSATPWQRDPDAAFYVALFSAVADYCLRHNTAAGYEC
jgi:hypothetical protein